jgi:hypothetical protein
MNRHRRRSDSRPHHLMAHGDDLTMRRKIPRRRMRIDVAGATDDLDAPIGPPQDDTRDRTGGHQAKARRPVRWQTVGEFGNREETSETVVGPTPLWPGRTRRTSAARSRRVCRNRRTQTRRIGRHRRHHRIDRRIVPGRRRRR